MNILFLTMNNFKTIKEHGIYTDLLRYMSNKGHNIYVVSPIEKKYKERTSCNTVDNITIIKAQTGNLFNVNPITKLISRFFLKFQFKSAIFKFLNNKEIDLVLYTTPPTTLAPVVEKVKKKYNATSYLMLKDIFPQNAVDLGMIKKNSIPHRILRNMEKKLYRVSDYIGCMSPANVDYLLANNAYIRREKVGICPNCFDFEDKRLNENEKRIIKDKYNIPKDKKVFIYGGNLGKPQGIDFLVNCLDKIKNDESVFFLIIGEGTEYELIEKFINNNSPSNIRLMRYLEKEEYAKIVASCDVGMIFLDHRFTIPNFPSRILEYMQSGLPIIAATDPNTDVGKIIESGDFGWWCESDDVTAFLDVVNKAKEEKKSPQKEIEFLMNNYSTECCYSAIMNAIEG